MVLRDKGIYTFTKENSPKENAIARLEFELAFSIIAASISSVL